ncbi:ABC-type multidrug transport system, ATPase component [Shewanella psychrophila]|uniref:ABC-type multidrug transport system, ATPase component n=1 Tax=Shewanella psychrophila TaxID=225848 RepID=A0A1S6HX59_9GAMM|nr:ABC transporter ATP-binding protein [Shewanella psychrophila]AQS40072.1 ABC-type multidrug transport system, ATPase component [Shewanella psychrophila]
MVNTKNSPIYALEIKDLKKTYKGGVEAVKGISLTVEKGDFFALLGPNGAGKSTTIGVISSLVQKSSGKVSVFEHDIDKELELAKLRIGLVPQEFNFNQFEKVLQIVVNQAGYYGVKKELALERAEKYLTQLDLWEKRDSPARALSGGMKRRLMIARALMHEPQLLILDEPTAGVDIELRRSMWTFLTELNEQGVTIILTTHYLEEAEMLCRNIGIIDKGVLVECTSMKSLLSRLNMETFVLDLGKDLRVEPSLDGIKCRLSDGHTLEVDVAKEQSLNGVFSQLSDQGIEVLSMRNKANRLEELFVELVEKGAIEPDKSSELLTQEGALVDKEASANKGASS